MTTSFLDDVLDNKNRIMKCFIMNGGSNARQEIEELKGLLESVKNKEHVVKERYSARSLKNKEVDAHFWGIFKRLVLCQNELDFAITTLQTSSSEPKLHGDDQSISFNQEGPAAASSSPTSDDLPDLSSASRCCS